MIVIEYHKIHALRFMHYFSLDQTRFYNIIFCELLTMRMYIRFIAYMFHEYTYFKSTVTLSKSSLFTRTSIIAIGLINY